MIQLFDDQRSTLELLRRKIAMGKRSVLLQGSTGSGKTVMAASMILGAQAKDKKTWFILPRKELMRQTAQTYQQFGISHGYIAAGYGHNPYEDNYLCMDKTLVRRLDGLTPPDVAIIDECHVAGAGMNVVVDWLKSKGSYIIGLSATPWKLSGKGLCCHYDDMVCGPSIRWLIDNKRLCEYRIFTAATTDVSGVGRVAGDFNQKQLEGAMLQDGKRLRNAVDFYLTHAAGKRTVAYGVSIKDCNAIADQFTQKSVRAVVISGDTPDVERVRMIRAFADREIDVLVSCDLLTYGFDLAAQVGRDVTVEAMVDLAPTLSLAKQLQKWGRVLRYKEEPAVILDLAGNMHEHDKPCADRAWTLEDRKKKPVGGSEEQEKTIALRQCLSCGYTFKPAPVCPMCNEPVPIKERSIDEVDGTLVEVDVAQYKKQQRQQVGKARTLSELRRIARERGYKPGWVYQQARIKNITN